MNKNYDDGNWNWTYECKRLINTYDPKDYYYEIAFESDNGGYLTGNEIICQYIQSENILKIHKNRIELKFYVENFIDIKNILKPMIKVNNLVPYPIHISNNSIRKDKLNNLK